MAASTVSLRRQVVLCSIMGFAAWAGPARADAGASGEPFDERNVDVRKAAAVSSTPEAPPRPWLYLDDPSLPAPLRIVSYSRATYTHGTSPTRPFGANLARPGGVAEFGAEIGLLSWMSVAANAFAGGDERGMGALAGVRLAPFASAPRTTHLVLSGGYLRELGGSDGVWTRLALSQDFGRARLGVTAHGEKVFARGRDALDVMVMAGASYELVGPLRAGIEYVAQDLEGALDAEEVEGIRHFVGPTLALALFDKHLSLNMGPAFGLSAGSPPVTGRLGLAYLY